MADTTLRNQSTVNVLVVAALCAIAAGYIVPRGIGTQLPASATGGTAAAQASSPAAATPTAPAAPVNAAPAKAVALPAAVWAAAAPGRVEPAGGEVRMTAQAAGRILEVLAGVNDKVRAGELLIRLDDGDAEARVGAAESEASVRRRERDAEPAPAGVARDRRVAEDALAAAERTLASNLAEHDRLTRARRAGTSTQADADKARDAVTTARDAVETAKSTLRRLLANPNMPLQTRLESAMSAARMDLALADAALERTRLRAPMDATVLQVHAVVGETAAPSPEQVMIVLGDTSRMRVRAEIEERDTGKVRIGQVAIIRSDAFPGRDFEGKVSRIAQALGPGRIGLKGPRRGLEVDVLEVLVDVDGTSPLLTGMRVDVLLKPE